jgi:peptide/nickel transport system permease protein
MSFLRKRLLIVAPLLIVISFLSYAMLSLLPGDPAVGLLGAAAVDQGRVAEVRQELRLDKPMPIRYALYMRDVLTGDMKKSYRTNQPVTTFIKQRLPCSIQLMLMSLVISLMLSIPLGLFAAYRSGSRLDRWIMGTSFGFLSVPGFVLGLALMYLFAVKFKLFPATGYTPFTENPLKSIRSLTLPAFTVSAGSIATYLRLLRTDLVGTLKEDFILMAKAKGLSDKRILLRHAFRPSSFTLLTVIGVNVAQIIGQALVVEQLFALPGMGRLIVESISTRDLYTVLGCILLITFFFIIVTTIVDLLYGLLDPRVRVKTAG